MEGDAVPRVREFLVARTRLLRDKAVDASRIAWDPGIGFGKTVRQNFSLLARQHELDAGHPLVIGWSRKSSLGQVTGLPVNERMAPSVAAAVLAVERGAHVVRVHDVKETIAALKVREAMQGEE
jgi:dihydropteroate synthase